MIPLDSRVAIRGYHTSSSTQGINTRLDGVPLNDFGCATAPSPMGAEGGIPDAGFAMSLGIRHMF